MLRRVDAAAPRRAGIVEDRRRLEKMRVCVDGRLLASAATGVASYARAVIDGLTQRGLPPLTLDDVHAGRFGHRATPADKALRHARALLPGPVKLAEAGEALHARDVFKLAQVRFSRTGRLLRLVAPGRPGIMHWTYPIPARIDGWVNIYTVHDVIPIRRHGLSPILGDDLRRRLSAICAEADHVVAVSRWARRTILEVLDVAPERVTDCGSAATDLVAANQALPGGLSPGSYYLFCGLIEARKNLRRVTTAWQASGSQRALVVVGPDGENGAAIREWLVRRGVTVLSYQPRGRLVDLIAGARALVFPTLAEGFGIPVIEANILGTPVLTSGRGALLETGGEGALFVDPLDSAAITRAMTLLDSDDLLCRDLSTRGRVNAERFTSARLGTRLIKLYGALATAKLGADAGAEPVEEEA